MAANGGTLTWGTGIVLLASLAACGHDAPSVPPAQSSAVGSATDHLQQVLASEGIHHRGDTPVDAGSVDAFARSFVAILASGDQRSALALFHGDVWDRDCSSEATRPAAEKLGGLMVAIPRNIHFAAVEPVGESRVIVKGQRLAGCAVTAETTARVIHVTWTEPAGDETLEIARAGNGAWTLTAVRDR